MFILIKMHFEILFVPASWLLLSILSSGGCGGSTMWTDKMLRPWGPDSNPSSTRTVPRDRPGRHSALWNTEKKNQD